MARDVLKRLAEAGVVTSLPRANSRATLYYKVESDDPVWAHDQGLGSHDTFGEQPSSGPARR
jgi:hypothetical protein